jgi:hypothetical protein
MTTSADYFPPELLDTFAKNFIVIRYPYEAYEQVSMKPSASGGGCAMGAGGRGGMCIIQKSVRLTESIKLEVMAC